MGKWISGLGLGLVMGVVQPALAQDPFTMPSYEPPIIHQPISIAQNDKARKSRAQNAHVRANRTPAQDFIYKRAVFQAQQRTRRIEERKWKGTSLLRPSNPPEVTWYEGYSIPVWYWANLK